MVSFDIDGTVEQSKAVVNRLKLFKLAVSLGDCESLVQHPFAMTHRGLFRGRDCGGGAESQPHPPVRRPGAPRDIIADLEPALSVLN